MADDPNKLRSLSLPDHQGMPFKAIPHSDHHVTVSALDGGTFDNTRAIWLEGTEGNFTMPSLVFLIENKSTGSRVLWDLGVRKDCSKYPKDAVEHINDFLKGSFYGPTVAIPDQLKQRGVSVDSIDAAVISHTHFDHVGDLDYFPKKMDVVLGPGATGSIGGALTIWPEDLSSGRNIRELTDKDFNIQIGSFKAHDFWGDGSLYLLDAPGHLPGHIAALARTSSDPDAFLLLIGDASHHRGLFSCCVHSHPRVPTYHSPEGVLSCFEHDLRSMYDTLARVARLETEENVMAVLAHDPCVLKVLDKYDAMWPKNMNEWFKGGWKKEVDEIFLEDRKIWAK